MPTITESIVREAPEVEAFKLGLLKSGKTLADVSLQLPTQQVAGLSPLEQQAIAQAGLTGGIGGYRQLAQGGRDTLGTGLGTMGSALGALGTAPGYLDESVGALGRSEQRMVQTTGQGPAALGYDAGLFQPDAALGYDAGQFQPGAGYTAQGYDPGSVAAYFNPYEDSAVQQALTDIRRQGDIASNQQNAAAVQAGAFGGSRQGLQSAELTRNILEQQGRTAAGMRQAGFQNAMQQSMAAFEEQQRRAQAESQFGTSAGQQAFEAAQRRQQAQAQFGTSSAQQLFEDQQRRQQAAALQQSGIASIYGNLAASQQALGGQYGKIGQAQANLGVQQLNAAQQAQQQGLGEFQALQQAGNLERQQTQSALNADFQNQQRQLYEPQTRLSWLSDIFKGAPSGQSSIGSQVAPQAPTPSLFQQVASAGTGLLGAYAGSKQIGKLF